MMKHRTHSLMMLFFWSTVAFTASPSPLDQVDHLIDDDCMLCGYVDLSRVDLDTLLKAALEMGGDATALDSTQPLLRDRIAAIQREGVHDVFIVMSMRDLTSGPCLLAPVERNVDRAQALLTAIVTDLHLLPPQELTVTTKGRTILLGGKKTVERLESFQGPSLSATHRAEIEAAWQGVGDVEVKLAFTPSRDTRIAIQQLSPAFPPPLAQYNIQQVLDGAQWAAFGLATEEGMRVRLLLHAKDQPSSETMAEILRVATEDFAASYTRTLGTQFAADVTAVRKLLTPEQRDDELFIEVSSREFGLIQRTLLAPMRRFAGQNQLLNNLKQIALAMLNFESNWGAYPPHASYDATGKPMLSWRVYLLPYLDANDLYKQFHLDEPWDSEHNRKLIEQMPEVFENFTGQVEKGKTTLQVPYGKQTVFFGKSGTKLREITDGTSRTLLCVDVAPEHAVIWTKPDDWEVDLENPLKGLLGDREAFAFCRCDGSAQRMEKSAILAEEVKVMATKSAADTAATVPPLQ